MAKPELGLKRTCVACGAKFYDLTRQPAVCPKCDTEQPAEQPRARRAAAPVEEKVKKRVPAAADTDSEDDVELEDVGDDDALDDSDDLEDSEDDLDSEIEVETDREDEN
ncbi:TIGR02300 family protein [Pseudoroseomonas globiformis]|uniref:TIGR02300 family protein n=1 Tax=Teichococcus globiformis TaxID=2307229 RepID=A0ABV7FXC6_9PROT